MLPCLTKTVVLVPYLGHIEPECEQGLNQLPVRVERRGGCSAIDAARNSMISDAIHDGYESIMFIDSDIGFKSEDAMKLINSPEPVISGIYSKKGIRQLTCAIAKDVKIEGICPLIYAATGFLRIKTDILRQMITQLKLPLCDTHWGRGMWPFFQPLVIQYGANQFHYLREDWAFSHRLGQIGITPVADTSIKLTHWGRYGYT